MWRPIWAAAGHWPADSSVEHARPGSWKHPMGRPTSPRVIAQK